MPLARCVRGRLGFQRYIAGAMLLIYMKSGECIEVEAAVAARIINHEILCFDPQGVQAASFPEKDVAAYTLDTATARLMENEVCNEVTFIPSGFDQDTKPAKD